MEAPVMKGRLEIYHGETSYHACSHHVLDAFFHPWDVLLGHNTTLNFTDELETSARFNRLKLNRHVSKLARSTTLLLVHVAHVCRLGDTLPVVDLGGAHVSLNVELPLETVHDDFQVQFAHTFNHGLVRLFVPRESERRVLLGKLDKPFRHLIEITFCLWLDCNLDDRVWEVHFFKNHGLRLVAESFTSRRILESRNGDDIAGEGRVDILPTVGVHLEQPAHPLLLALCGVHHVRPRLKLATVDPSKGQGADEWV
mmetsp:Transcript_10102/g.25624  ORF Transcript_10102/g.25624 Transcript_10102/m.25624 type:complete len:255 (+) Transcript_10102:1588-2352(+)